jgi:hypothetical protein
VYKSFEVKNFRCFREFKVVNLERVNLIAGVNNVGKTALLEALFLHSGAYSLELSLRLNMFRGIGTAKIELERWRETPWDSFFRNFDTSKEVELAGENDITGRRVLRLKVIRKPEELASISQLTQPSLENLERSPLSSEVAHVLELEYTEGGKGRKYHMILAPKAIRIQPIPPPPPFPAFFQGSRMRFPPQDEAERFGRLQVRGEEEVLLQVLQIVEPRLCRLAMVVTGGEPILHGDIGLGHLMPLPLMGEGMARLASLVLHMSDATNGVMLVDEIENGLHHSILVKVWRAIGEVARRFNTQVFATTHSRECIVAAHKAFTESDMYDFRLHRLEQIKGVIRAITYDQETLAAAIEAELEVR